jgi:hypothetical protein
MDRLPEDGPAFVSHQKFQIPSTAAPTGRLVRCADDDGTLWKRICDLAIPHRWRSASEDLATPGYGHGQAPDRTHPILEQPDSLPGPVLVRRRVIPRGDQRSVPCFHRG